MPTPKQFSSNAARQAAYRARLKTRPKPEAAPKPKPLPSNPGKARWRALQAQAQTALEALRDELQEAFDEKSERWQEGERGEEWQQHIGSVETALEAVEALEEE